MKTEGRETRAAVEKNGAAEDPAAWRMGQMADGERWELLIRGSISMEVDSEAGCGRPVAAALVRWGLLGTGSGRVSGPSERSGKPSMSLAIRSVTVNEGWDLGITGAIGRR